MKAILCTRYGPPEVLQLKDVAKPVPKHNEVLIKVYATAVTASDIFIRGSQIPLRFLIPMRLMIGVTKPRRPILGLVMAGDVETVGKNVKQFKPGDSIYGFTGFGFGAYAEYVCVPETESTYGCLSLKPKNISYTEATAAVYGGLLAMQYLERGNIQRGQKVLIYGASGSSGTTAVQLAKHLGAEVTGVCSTRNLELVKSLGADEVLDYTRTDTLPAGKHYDFILDAVGKMKRSPLKMQCRSALAPGGKYVSIDDGALKLSSARLRQMKALIEAGYIKPVMDRIYPLEQIVEAHRYVEQGHKHGSVAIAIASEEKERVR